LGAEYCALIYIKGGVPLTLAMPVWHEYLLLRRGFFKQQLFFTGISSAWIKPAIPSFSFVADGALT
jgi:hypothetical protein